MISGRVVGRRFCAVLAVISAALHGMMVVNATNVAVVVLTVAMLAVCLYCAYGLWFRGTLRDWTLIALMNLAMIAVHLPMSVGHHHGGVDVTTPQHSMLMMLATAVAAIEVVVAAGVLYYMTRARARILVQ